MLYNSSRGEDGIFYKVAGRMGVYGLKVIFPFIIFVIRQQSVIVTSTVPTFTSTCASKQPV